jgi:hypothetical protein
MGDVTRGVFVTFRRLQVRPYDFVPFSTNVKKCDAIRLER